MKKLIKKMKSNHRLIRSSLLAVFLIVLLDALSLAIDHRSEPMHSGAPTFTVCHAIPRAHKDDISQGRGERYFCSNDGCYSDQYEEMSVIGSYQDGNTCAGIAENLSK